MDVLQLKGLLANTGYELSSSLGIRQGRAWMALMIHAGNFLPLEKEHVIDMKEFCQRASLTSDCENDAKVAIKDTLEGLMRISAFRTEADNYYRHTLITWFAIEGDKLRYSLDGAFLHRILPIITRSN
ncbi:MAG: hypothetical protein AAF564_16800 [Bacteroidota bacterium]